MHNLTACFLTFSLLFSMATYAETIEVEIHGMTCAFCVDSLRRQLKKLPDIEQVDVSLKHRKVRIISKSNNMDVQQIRDIVINAGFTPINIRTISDEH